MRPFLWLSALIPMFFAVSAVCFQRFEGVWLFAMMLATIGMLGILIMDLAAPLVLWKRHRWWSFCPLALFLALGTLAMFGLRPMAHWALRGTAASPDTFLSAGRQRELEEAVADMDRNEDCGPGRTTFYRYGLSASVDTARHIVVLRHLQVRTRHTYIYAAGGLPAPYTGAPRIFLSDLRWGEIRPLAKAAAKSKGVGGSLATRLLIDALGDSAVAALADVPTTAPIPLELKTRFVGALNRDCAESFEVLRFVELRTDGEHARVYVDGACSRANVWQDRLAEQLLSEGVLRRASDGTHLQPGRVRGASDANRVGWLQAGALNIVFGDLLDADDVVYDRKLRDHWYYAGPS